MSNIERPATSKVVVAGELAAVVIVMVSERKRGFGDVLHSGTVNLVLRHTPCLVFTLPEGGF